MCEATKTTGSTPTTLKTRGVKRRGIAILYGVAMMGTLCGLTSLAVDFGRVQMTKCQLRVTADAAARAGAGGLAALSPRTQAMTNAIQFAAANSADGSPVVLDPAKDIEIGLWQNNTFTVVAANSSITPNAVHITLHRSQSRGNAVPLLFGKLLGSGFCDVSADSIAQYIPAVNVNQNVMANANPFLSGTPAGTTASQTNPSDRHIADVAGTTSNPLNSPMNVNLPLGGNAAITFDSISGNARHDPSLADYAPDGETDDIGHNNLTTNSGGNYSAAYTNENGISDMKCPINALVGVFLDDSDPRVSSAPTPANLDFSTDASRDFSELKPQLKQLFFIGDGLMNNGVGIQKFYAPTGATHLYLATWDFYEWNNNSGARLVKVARPGSIITVR